MTGQRAASSDNGPGDLAVRTAEAVTAVAARHTGVEKAALTAALEELATSGVKGLTVEKVAARSGVAKTTLYRRWRSKEELALAVLLDMARAATTAPVDTDVRAGLIGYLEAVVAILRDTLFGRVMQGLASDLATDPAMAEAFRREVVTLRQEHLAQIVRHGIDDGQLRSDLDLSLLQELLFGPVYYRLLFSGHPLEDDLAQRIVDTVLPGILAGSLVP